MPIITNSANRIVIRTQDNAAETVTLGNGAYNGVNPTGYVITKILWTCANAALATVTRNGTALFKGSGNGVWDLNAMGLALSANSGESIVVGCANGTIIVEAKKLPSGSAT